MIALSDTDTTLSRRRPRTAAGELRVSARALSGRRRLDAASSLIATSPRAHAATAAAAFTVHVTSISPPGVFHILFNEL